MSEGRGGEAPVALVADDDPLLRAMLEDVCRQIGLRVRSCQDGIEVLAELDRAPVDIVLLDLAMPRLDGFGVLEALRATPGRAVPPVIIVTANADAEGKIRGTRLGAIDFVEKPFRLADLTRRIERVLSIGNLERKLRDEERQLDTLRGTDPVTGVGTFGVLHAALEAQFACARVTAKPLSCLVVADEGYGSTLAQRGRVAGEERLRSFVQALEKQLRGADVVYRVDASEFVVFLPGTPSVGARRAIERMRESFAAQPVLQDAALSIGVATYPHPEIQQPSHLYRAVNVALAQARSQPGQRVAYFEGF